MASKKKKVFTEQPAVDYRFIPVDQIVVDYEFNVMRSDADYAPDNTEMAELISSMREAGFSPSEPVLITEVKDTGVFLLDGGFRRVAAAQVVGIKEVPALVYVGSEDDPYRRERNASENATVPPTWHGQASMAAALSAAGFDTAQVAARMVKSPEHITLLLRTKKFLTKVISKGIIPEEEAEKLSLNDAKEFSMFKLEKSGDEPDAKEAWNHFVKTGAFPRRASQNENAGRKPKDGWSKKQAVEKLLASPVFQAREEGARPVYWDILAKVFPPKNSADLTTIEGVLLGWADAVPEIKPAPSPAPQSDATKAA
jgi:Predicted transcriptional regulators